MSAPVAAEYTGRHRWPSWPLTIEDHARYVRRWPTLRDHWRKETAAQRPVSPRHAVRAHRWQRRMIHFPVTGAWRLINCWTEHDA